MTERTPVLIVGGGPVGLTLAGDLAWRGQACVLVRPDGHEAWRDVDLPEDAGAVLDVVRGAPARQRILQAVKGGGASRAAS